MCNARCQRICNQVTFCCQTAPVLYFLTLTLPCFCHQAPVLYFLNPKPNPDLSLPQAPVLYFLSGLTCTDENFIQKSGAQRAASEKRIALVVPDTSPRGLNVPGEADSWDFGVGAGRSTVGA